QYVTGLVTYNTNCCGFSVQYRHVNLPGVTTNKDQFRFAFAIANIATTLGNLKKQDRLF
ncbi:MAG: Organic solvent tolerance protein, partial [Candidatus Solibacter sp.]|nr:Organic solvent tolerance protein [Candidatus Solibacter sp.]